MNLGWKDVELIANGKAFRSFPIMVKDGQIARGPESDLSYEPRSGVLCPESVGRRFTLWRDYRLQYLDP